MRFWTIAIITALLGISGFSAESTAADVVRIAKKQKKSSKEDEKKQRTKDGKLIVKSENIVLQDSSEYWRQNLTGSVNLELIGMVPFPGSGVAGGYFVTPNDMIEASYHYAKLDFLFFELTSSLFELRWKRFWGNSFYTNMILGSRTIGGKATLEPITGNDDIESSVSVQSYGAGLSIGNRWQWETFTMGCDWIGAFFPLSKGEVKVTNTTGAEKEDVDDAEDDTDALAKKESGMLLRFHLGFSF